MWARPHLVLALPFFIAELVLRQRETGHGGWGAVRPVAGLAAPLALAAAALLGYNWARFGKPLDFGYSRASADPALAQDLDTYGQFSLHYLDRNAAIALGGLPDFQASPPFFTPRLAGMSIFLTTPALLYLFRRMPRAPWEWGAWAAVAALNVPLLLYYNTGWQQFGYRFSLDYMPLALSLVAANAGRRISPVLAALIGLSCLINLRGIVWWLGGP